MALVTSDRIKEKANVVGFNGAVLTGSPSGFMTFSSVMDIGDTCYYSIVDEKSGAWETGIGTLVGVHSLERTFVNTSSNNNLRVLFAVGEKIVSLAFTSDQLKTYSTIEKSVSAFNERVGNITLRLEDISSLANSLYVVQGTDLQFRRGNSTEISLITPLIGEPIYNTETKELKVGDGTTVGGLPALVVIDGGSANG